MGGIQKSLVNALKAYDSSKYDVSLLLFNSKLKIKTELPSTVKILNAGKLYSILSEEKREIKKNVFAFFIKGIFYVYTKIFNRKSAMSLIGIFKKKLTGYDYAVSFSQPFDEKVFAGGEAEFVLSKVDAKEKCCFIHCDYLNSGSRCAYNDKLLTRFDKIICVSESVRKNFLTALPKMKDKSLVLKNVVDKEEIIRLSNQETVEFNNEYINLVTVARLSKEKGVDRAINAINRLDRKDIRYYVVGGGVEEQNLKRLIQELDLTDRVFLLGEKENPYVYMKNADYLLVPSRHEAAPMVFEEAKVLDLSIISTNTVSAEEMVGTEFGVVCENTENGIYNALHNL